MNNLRPDRNKLIAPMRPTITLLALLMACIVLLGCQHTSTDGQPSTAMPTQSTPKDPTESWLPGELTCMADGTTLSFRIEKKFAWGGRATGGVAATHPGTGKRFIGTYNAIMQNKRTASAIAALTGDKGTVIQLDLQIQSGFRPHGIGSGSDNQGRRYTVQF